jgi:hypothetical protein
VFGFGAILGLGWPGGSSAAPLGNTLVIVFPDWGCLAMEHQAIASPHQKTAM